MEDSFLLGQKALRAAIFAEERHRGVNRKSGEAYFFHPHRVAVRVAQSFNEEAVVVAYLHDVMEDCGCSFEAIEREFGGETAQCVASLSADRRLPKHAREAAFCEQICSASPIVKLVKAADGLDNATTLDSLNLERALRWIKKTRRMIKAIREGDLGEYQSLIMTFTDATERTIEAAKESRELV